MSANRSRYKKFIFAFFAILMSFWCHAQSNVYSACIYAGGAYYSGPEWSFDFPFPPYHYSLSEYGQYEDADGLVIIDVGHERERGGFYCRYVEVKCGSEVFFTVPLDRVPPERVRKLRAESADRERREKAWIASGFFQIKTFNLSNRTDSGPDQEALYELERREKFRDGFWTRAMGPEPNLLRITASTNDMVIWERIIREFDKPHPK